ARLNIARQHMEHLTGLASRLHADSMDDLLRIYELTDRLEVCKAVIAHLAARHETRWPGFGIDRDHPEPDPTEESYVNSRIVNGNLEILRRPLVREEEVYEHPH
ncbi:MAG: adenylylsulfate reductase, partial [Faecalibacterium sp.]